MISTYNDLIAYFKEKVQSIEGEEVSIFIKNLKTKKEVAIIDNTDKKYNWVCIVYDPQKKDPMLKYTGPKDERSYFYCHNLKDALTIGDYIIENINIWYYKISPLDMLEQELYYKS